MRELPATVSSIENGGSANETSKPCLFLWFFKGLSGTHRSGSRQDLRRSTKQEIAKIRLDMKHQKFICELNKGRAVQGTSEWL